MKNALLTAGLLAAAATAGHAQVRAMTLDEMMAACDECVHGEIVSSKVSKVIDRNGHPFYYTTITVEGEVMGDRTPITVDLVFPGGFLNEEEGTWNSESPSADEVKVGNRIVAFYKWFEGFGGVSANHLYANHGGLFRTVVGPRGATVLGRGKGYAVSKNVRLTHLDASIKAIKELRRR